MIFVELFAPAGTLGPHERNRLAERLMTEVAFDEPALPLEMETAIGNAEVVVHQPAAWSVAGSAADALRFVVRVSVPAGWHAELSRHLPSRLTRVLRGVPGSRARVAVQVVAAGAVSDVDAVLDVMAGAR